MKVKISQFLVAENAIIDSRKKSLSVVNIMEEGFSVVSEDFPVILPNIVFVVRYVVDASDNEKEIQIKADILDNKGSSIRDGKIPDSAKKLTPEEGIVSYGDIFELSPVFISKPGKYKFRISVGSAKKDLEIEFRVKK